MTLRNLSALVLVSRGRVIADPVANAVIEWSGIVQRAIHGPATPPSAGASEILHTMVHLAVYDAVVAVDGGSRPFAARIAAKPGAELRAAVATAAYLTVRPCIAGADLTTLDQAYATYLAGLPTVTASPTASVSASRQPRRCWRCAPTTRCPTCRSLRT